VTAEPRGVYRTQGEDGKPNTVLLESGTLGFDIPEQEYRDNKYKPESRSGRIMLDYRVFSA